jgi:polysaccharide biosynthesis protein PelB
VAAKRATEGATDVATHARSKRSRIASTWLVLTLAVVVLATMYAVSRRGGMRERVASVGAPSDLSVAYLEAWSRVQPDNAEFLSLLGAQYLYLGRVDDAARVAARMDAMHTDDMRRAATMLRLAVAEQRTFAIAEADPRRAASLADLRERLSAAARDEWAPRDLEWLAQRAAAAGLPRLATDLYTRLSEHDPQGRDKWDTQITRYALQVGDYRAAANAWFRKQAAAQTRDEQRRCFIAGIRVLQSGNLLADALAAADTHLGTLADDPATLIVLLNLARAADRPDIVDRYARMLARYAQAQPAERHGQRAFADAVWRGDIAAGYLTEAPTQALTQARSVSYAYRDGPVAWPTSSSLFAARDGARLIRVAMAIPSAASSAGSNANVADVVFNAFIESGDLASAENIAAQQVQRDPRSVLWVKRLAQTAEWNRDPARALKSWLDYAQLSDDPVGWQNVLRIAPMLDDDEAYLAALLHQARATPGDLKLVDNVTATYERLGRPDDALAFLRSLPRGANSDALDQRIGALAERAGHDDQALAAYRAVQARHPHDANAALRTASVLYRAGDYRASFAALKRARAGATEADEDFWRDYAELARLLQLDSDANDAYRHLLASGAATPEELGEMTYFYDPYPIDAGRVAELRYRRDHTPRALQDAIFYYTDAQAFDRIAALLASLTPDERRAAEASPGVLAVRAEYARLTDRPLDALADLERAVQLPDATSDMRAAYLWTLVDYGSDAALKRALNRWRGSVDRSAALWEPYAAAEMRLNRPVAALEYLRREAASLSRDPLWLLTYADAQEMAGHDDLAWSIRHKVWLQLQQNAAALAKLHGAPRAALRGRTAQDAETLADLCGRRVALSTDYTTADASSALLDDLLSTQAAPADLAYVRRTLLGSAAGLPGAGPDDGAQLAQNSRLHDAVAKEVAVAWAVSHESNPLAKRWLAQQYAARLTRPADAQLTIALADNDLPELERLLAQERSRLPIADRIDATIAVDQPDRAQRIAFEGLEGAPEDTALHTRVTETALDWPQSIDATVTSHVEHPLDYIEQTLAASRKIAERYMVGVTGVQNFQHSTDITQLVNVPSVDRSLSFYARRQTRDDALQVTAGRRDALDSFYTFELAAETGRNSALTLGVRAGRNQVADETQTLQVGGMKDNLIGDFTYRVTERITVTGSVEADRFYSQARSYIGSGVLSTGEISYRFHNEYPDYTVRVTGTHGGYGASGGADPLISRLIPAANQPAVAGDFLPDTYTQYGVYFGFGNDLLEQYTHRWRPFLDVGIVHDSIQGWGPDVNVGVAGTVFGGDHLALFFEHQSVSRLGTPVTILGARYSWYY